jgi:hypothetical protein
VGVLDSVKACCTLCTKGKRPIPCYPSFPEDSLLTGYGDTLCAETTNIGEGLEETPV